MNEQYRTAIITGGAQGIGKATVHRLLCAGWAVVIADIDEEAGAEAAEEFRGLGPVLFVPTDVSAEEQVRRVVATAVERFGGLDLLMNNAYASVPWRPLVDCTLEMWHRVMAVNVTAIFLTTKHALPHLRARRGSIVNIASILALRTYPNVAAYGTSKGAIVALSHALAISLAPEVRVNSICPGLIDTVPWLKSSKRARKKRRPADNDTHPVGRVGTPEDIAATVAYLASPAAAFITGENFVVDGGAILKLQKGGYD